LPPTLRAALIGIGDDVVSERSIKATANKKATARGAWLVNFPSFGTRNGTPDTLGVYRGLFIAIEYKAPDGVVSRLQGKIQAKIRKAGGRVCVPRSVAEVVAFLDDIDREIADLVHKAGAP
jgi:hypothetical protein